MIAECLIIGFRYGSFDAIEVGGGSAAGAVSWRIIGPAPDSANPLRGEREQVSIELFFDKSLQFLQTWQYSHLRLGLFLPLW